MDVFELVLVAVITAVVFSTTSSFLFYHRGYNQGRKDEAAYHKANDSIPGSVPFQGAFDDRPPRYKSLVVEHGKKSQKS